MNLTPVESSMIEAVGYDEERQELSVRFNSGNLYVYHEVPKETYEGLMEADSKGSYMREEVIDMFPYLPAGRRRRRR